MKIYLTFLFSLFLNSFIYSQKNVVKIVPTNLLDNTFTLQYERVLSDRKSIQIEFNYMAKSYVYDMFLYNFEGFGIETALKYNIGKKKMPKGWYFSPIIGTGRLYASSYNRKEMGTFLNIGNNLGHQWVIGNHRSKFTIDINGGFGLVYFKNDEVDNYIHCSGLVKRLDIGLGYAF